MNDRHTPGNFPEFWVAAVNSTQYVVGSGNEEWTGALPRDIAMLWKYAPTLLRALREIVEACELNERIPTDTAQAIGWNAAHAKLGAYARSALSTLEDSK